MEDMRLTLNIKNENRVLGLKVDILIYQCNIEQSICTECIAWFVFQLTWKKDCQTPTHSHQGTKSDWASGCLLRPINNILRFIK